MADEKDAGKLAAELQALKADGKVLQRTLTNVACDYGAFMKKYNEANDRILAYSAEVEDISKSGGDPAGQNSIVLVFIDASSHKFCNELLKKYGPGGAEAAIKLRSAVNERVAAKFPEVSRNKYCLIIRIFASLKTLSMNAAANKSTSLAPFFTEFEKVGPFFDLVVVADDFSVKSKICENFKLYMASTQCKHVFLAAAESPRYHQLLEPFRKETSKVTLVSGSGLDGGLRKLGLLLVSFLEVFAASPGVKAVAVHTKKPASSVTAGVDNDVVHEISSKSDSDAITNFIDVDTDTKAQGNTSYSNKLPSCYIGGRIPINSEKHRIDIYVRTPSAKEINVYETHFKGHRLCNHHYLGKGCAFANCQNYHGVLEPEAYQVLQYKVLSMPCSKAGRCRVLDCPYGHICQRDECSRAGKCEHGCRMPILAHDVDLKVAEWIKPDGDSSSNDGVSRIDANSTTDEDTPAGSDDLMLWT